MPAAGPTASRRSAQRRVRTVLELFGAGVPVEEIAGRLRLRRATVRRVLRAAGAPVDAQETKPTKGDHAVKWIHLEDLEVRMDEIERKLAEEEQKTRAWIELQLDEASGDPDFARRAQERGQDLGDALIELAHQLERPYREIKQRRASVVPDVEDARIDRKARRYAERCGVTYQAALEAAIAGEAPVNPEREGAPGQPRTDAADVALNRRAEEYARRKGCSYAAALDAVTGGEEARR